MKQVFEHYEKWEDYQTGMYEMKFIPNEEEKINNAISEDDNIEILEENAE